MRDDTPELYLLIVAAFVVAAAIGGFLFFRDLSSGDPIDAVANRNAYDVLAWELQHLPEKWAYRLANAFAESNEKEEDETVRRYFELAAAISAAESAGPSAELREARRERDALENDFEDIMESRISDLLEDNGLYMNPPIFSDIDLFFPPLDFELDSPPRVLAVSPRDRIELERSYLLTPGLELEDVEAIEEETEDTGDVSALVVQTGGVATYPSVIPELASYGDMVETVIHEWLHQYLVFFPLGRSYFGGEETRTLNETVANMAGRELAAQFIERHVEPVPPPPPPAVAADFVLAEEMRSLRQRVQDLLDAGEVGQAEELMETKRADFEEAGAYFRRINQAYFAFHGSYADTPSSIDPIGPKMELLRKRAGSVGAFVRLARDLAAEDELDELLARQEGED
jgi:hypothetical protein